jgi:2-haloalkanoic acid dehalogenase type II
MAAMGIIAATFDCYGTLVDWDRGIGEFFRKMGQPMEKVAEWEKAQRERIQGPYRPYREIMRESLKAVTSQDISSFPDSLLQWPIFPDVSELGRAGVKLGILSNMDTDLLEATIKRLPVRIDFFVSAEQVRSYKPRTEHFKCAIELLGCRPSEIAHCAFGVWYDMAPAKSMGMKTVLVRRSRVKETGSPDAVVDSLAELPRTLASFC